MNDLISFYNNDDEAQEQPEQDDVESWKILIVDDDESIHQVTRLALNWVVLDDKPLEFISAYSGAEAKQKFAEHDDIALVLLDVVMETNKAGFDVANYIRHDLNNFITRIVLRTGQPGDVPEREVILNYEIDGYKTKSELTAQALFSMILTSLRSYRDLRNVEDNNKSLEKIVRATADIFEQTNFPNFIHKLLEHFSQLLPFANKTAADQYYFAADFKNGRLSYICGADSIAYAEGEELFQHLSPSVSSLLIEAYNKHNTIYRDGNLVIAGSGRYQQSLILYFADVKPLRQSFEHMLDVFRHNFETAHENLLLSIENKGHTDNLAKCLDERTQQLSQSQEQLFHAEKLSAIGQLTAGVTHEINNPLGLIKSNLSILGNSLKPLLSIIESLSEQSQNNNSEQLEKLHKLLGEINLEYLREEMPLTVYETDEGINRICNIVDALYHFTKLETSQFYLTDVRQILDSALADVPDKLKQGVNIQCNYADTPPLAIMSEPFRQALANIMQNAFEALQGQGDFKLQTKCQDEQLQISIIDTGKGIDAQIQKRIFDPFFSDKKYSNKKAEQGVGLGLYLSQVIIKLHNGQISVSSELGQGTTFIINLPLGVTDKQ